MNRYYYLIHESRQGETSIEANSEREATDKLMAMYKAGKIDFDFTTSLDHEVLETIPLVNRALPRFEIFGKDALIADMRNTEIDKLQGIEKLYRYDMRHGDDDSIPLTLERGVLVNRFATIFTAEPILEEGERARNISYDDWSYLSDLDDMTPEQFYEEAVGNEQDNKREYEIFQLNANSAEYLFLSTSELQSIGVSPCFLNYDSVHKAALEDGVNLDAIFDTYSTNIPDGCMGRLMSVSDVIVVTNDGTKTAWYVDAVGFTQLPDFFQPQQIKQHVQINHRLALNKAEDRGKRASVFRDHKPNRQDTTKDQNRKLVNKKSEASL